MINFRQYRGPITIEFSTDKEKNVTVFLGDNSAGKSTFIQAFMWAFYGEIDLERPKDILNKEVESEMYTNCPDEVVCVSVDLVHDGVRYIVEKKAVYGCKTPKSSYLKDSLPTVIWYYDGGEKIHANANVAAQFRDKIMPQDLSGYFFFDGEHIEKLYKRNDLKQSIAKIMGLTPLKNAVKHLDKVSSDFLTRVSTVPGDSQLRSLRAELKEANDKFESCSSKQQYLKFGLESAKTEYNNAHEALVVNKNTIDITEQYDRAIEESNRYAEKIEDQLVTISSTFNSSFFNILSYPIMNETQNILKEAKSKDFVDEGVPKMHADAIDYLIKRGRCICGSDLNSHPDLREHILKEKNYLPPKSIGAEVKSFNQVLRYRLDQTSDNHNYFDKAYDTYLDFEQSHSSATQIANSLLLDINRLKMDDVNTITDRFNEAKNKLDGANKSYNDNERDIRETKAKMENLEKRIAQVASQVESNRIPILCSQYAKQLAEDINNTVNIKEKAILSEFSKTLSDVFSNMYHGKRIVALDSDYNVDLIVDGVGATSKSSGTQVVLSFAFVCTLLKLARDQLSDIDSELKSEPYPLVMDAPSSSQDDKHIVVHMLQK